MRIPIPRWLAGRSRVVLAPSRILQAACTTRYGEAPGDDDVHALIADIPASESSPPPWITLGHRDTPAGTVWNLVLCPPATPRTGRNLPPGVEPGDGSSEVVLPEVLWALSLLGRGTAPSRSAHGPSGTWISRWEDGQPTLVDGPFPEGSPRLAAWLATAGEDLEDIPWRTATEEELLDLARENPESQMLSPGQANRRAERLADRVALARVGAVVVTALVLALAVRAPVWWLERSLRSTEERLAAVRPDIDRLDRLQDEALRDAAYLEASRPAFRPARTPLPLLSGLAGALPPGVRFLTLQLESPPGDSGWTLRADARLDDWRGVPVLVDSLRGVEGVADVRVGSQQRQEEKVHLVLDLSGRWP